MSIPKKDKQSRENKPHPDIEQHQHANGIEQTDKLPGKRQVVKGHKNKQDHQRQQKVDKRLHIFGKQEKILGNIDFGKHFCVPHQGLHPALCGFGKVGPHHISAENINGVVWGIAAKELGKYQPHHKEGQQGGKKAPTYAQNCTLIFLFKVSFDQFLKKKLTLY